MNRDVHKTCVTHETRIFKSERDKEIIMDDVAGIYAREIPYLDTVVQLGIAQGRVLSVDFPKSADGDAASDHDLLDRIERYVQGAEDDFSDVTVAMTMQTDHRTVLEKVREIPYGENASVKQVMLMVPGRDPDDEDDRRVVREALANNPTPIFVPTHRVQDGPGSAPAHVIQKLRSLEGL